MTAYEGYITPPAYPLTFTKRVKTRASSLHLREGIPCVPFTVMQAHQPVLRYVLPVHGRYTLQRYHRSLGNHVIGPDTGSGSGRGPHRQSFSPGNAPASAPRHGHGSGLAGHFVLMYPCPDQHPGIPSSRARSLVRRRASSASCCFWSTAWSRTNSRRRWSSSPGIPGPALARIVSQVRSGK